MIEGIKIVLLSIVAAIIYGILHDQITARVCVEYFTIGHPPIFKSESPTLLAFGWGVIATWWAGLSVGIPAAFAARVGSWPRMTVRDMIRPILYLLITMGLLALIAGVSGYFASRAGAAWLVEPLASRVPTERHDLFLAAGAAHLASYGAGFLGGLAISGWVVFHRKSQALKR